MSYRIILLVMMTLLVSCQQPVSENQPSSHDHPNLAKSLEKANRYLVRSEEEDIDDFVSRYGWNMVKSGTGLRYMIDSLGNGELVRHGQIVEINYTVRFLTGDIVYNSKELGTKSFVAGRGGVETGLEEGIKLLRKGDKAKFILPSHLAFGLLGDGNKIPSKTPLVYEVELIDIQ